jgi:hypothetical protein
MITIEKYLKELLSIKSFYYSIKLLAILNVVLYLLIHILNISFELFNELLKVVVAGLPALFYILKGLFIISIGMKVITLIFPFVLGLMFFKFCI